MSNYKSAIIYCRFSPRPKKTKKDDAGNEIVIEEDSNEKQEKRCHDYCLRKEYVVLDAYRDAGKSGKTIDRVGLTAAISALQPGVVLVVDTNDRLARDMLVALTIHHQVEQKGATIEAADGSPNRTTPEGRLMANILAVFAQYERERFARRTKAGLAKKKANGEWLGKPPIGWMLDKCTKQLVEEPYEQGVMKDILLKSSLGATSGEITNWTNQFHGYCRGKLWSARTVRKIIAREKSKKNN